MHALKDALGLTVPAGTSAAGVLRTAVTQAPQPGALPSALPSFHVPSVRFDQLLQLLGIAAALTMVALAQSIAFAKAVAARWGQRIDANREFLGQGLSNLAGGFFSCYVSRGSLNRSMPNLEAGARTRMARCSPRSWSSHWWR